MNTQKWNTIEPLLDKALELSTDKRTAFLNKTKKDNPAIYSELIELLGAIETSNDEQYLEAGSSENKEIIKNLSNQQKISEFIGRCIGVFRITDSLGQGGMGQVFKAERIDDQFQQQVAIKVVRREFYTKAILQRFSLEKKMLAKLSHPNIAKIFDGGVTADGHPYLVMEFVDGVPVTEYCNKKILTIDARLQLFKDVCKAVSYAHQNLIVHRDLKPQNIFVTNEGVVKILDFGIAKLMDTELSSDKQRTEPKNQYWTPHNAAPEEVEDGASSTATDVYALGILLHKLLTNHYPFDFTDKTFTEIRTTILSTAPNTLAESLEKDDKIQETAAQRNVSVKKLRKIAASDLHAVTAKAIKKNIAERYNTVNNLSEDITNYQKNLPVSARQPTFSYQFKRYLGRHKKPLIAATGVFFMIIAFAFFYTHQITKERNYALKQAQKADQLTLFLMDLFKASRPSESKGKEVTAGELLNRAEQRADMLATQPAIQAQMFDVIGRIYRRLGDFEKSYNLLNKSLSINKSLLGLKNVETLASMEHLGVLLTETEKYGAADSLLRQTLEIRKQFLEPDRLSITITQNNLAHLLRKEGYYEKAEALYRKSIQTQEKLLGADNPATIATVSSLAMTLHNQGEYAAAEKKFRSVLKRRRKLLGPVHPKLAMSINNLGAILMNRGQFKEAEVLFRESLVMREQLYDENHPKVALMLNNLGYVLYNQKKYNAAAPYLKQALTIRKKVFGEQSVAAAISRFCLGRLMLDSSRIDTALTLFKNAYHIFKDTYTNTHSFTVRSHMGMGNVFLKRGRLLKAGKYLQSGFQQIQQIHAPTSLEYALAEKQLGVFMLASGQVQKADSLFTHALQTLRTIEGEGSLRQQDIQKLLAQTQNGKPVLLGNNKPD